MSTLEIHESLGPLEVRFFGQLSGLAQETTKMCLKSLLLHTVYVGKRVKVYLSYLAVCLKI